MLKNNLFKSYYKSYGVRDHIWKHNINSLKDISGLEFIEVGVFWESINLTNNLKIVHSLEYLRSLTGVRGKINDYGIVKGSKGLNPEHTVSTSVVLKDTKMYNFLDYFYFVILANYLIRYGKLKFRHEILNSYTLLIKDTNIFYNLKEEYNFEEPIFIRLKFKGDNLGMKYLLEVLGIEKENNEVFSKKR